MKKQRIILNLILIMLTSVSISAQDLSSHEWKDRLLLILTTENSKDLYEEQMKILNDDIEGLEERKMVIYSVMPEQYKKGIHAKKWIESSRLNDRYRQEGKEFEVILLGLDGRVKLRQSEILSIEKLFGTIDVMPMRRNEIRNKK